MQTFEKALKLYVTFGSKIEYCFGIEQYYIIDSYLPPWGNYDAIYYGYHETENIETDYVEFTERFYEELEKMNEI